MKTIGKNSGRDFGNKTITVRWAAVAACWLAFSMAGAGQAGAMEFVTPPGQNVERQRAMLKERITGLAQTLLGKELVDVVAHVGYARTGPPAEGRIKLPGFNQYIQSDAPAGGEIVPEFLRIRQVFVVVTKAVAAETESLEKDLIAQGEMNPRKGDFLRVVVLGGPAAPASAGKDAEGAEGAASARKKRGPPPFPANEPESTVFLLRARTAYFKGNYDRALSEILKAVEVEPQSSQAYAMLGSLYYTINWKTLALKYWEKSLGLDPENQEIQNLVAQLRDQQG